MDIVDFDSIDVGDEIIVITRYGNKQEVRTVIEKGSSSLKLDDGNELSTWGRGGGEIAIKANHPEVISAKEDFFFQSITKALSFSSEATLKNKEVRDLLLRIYDIEKEQIDKRIKNLQSMSAIGRESQEISKVAEKIYKDSN